MKEKTNTQLFFDELIKDIQQLLKPLGFKKKALNFYRTADGIHSLVNVQKSAYNSAESIMFTFNICAQKTDDSPAPTTIHDYEIRKRLGEIIGEGDRWYELDGSIADIFRRKQAFAHTKAEVLEDIEQVVLPFLANITTSDFES